MTPRQPSMQAARRVGVGARLVFLVAAGLPAAGSAADAPALYSVSPAASAAAGAPALTGDRATDAFNWTNHRRAQLGLSPLLRDEALDRAAAAHLAYLGPDASRSPARHEESPLKPGFTGVSPGARAAAAGYSGGGTVGENIGYGTTADGRDAVDSLIEAPYHRQLQFGNFAVAGAAMMAGGTTAPAETAMSTAPVPAPAPAPAAGRPFPGTTASRYGIAFGGTAPAFGPGPRQLVAYPAAGETAAPFDWFAVEIPNPLPDLAGQRVGFPISLAATRALAVASFTLEDDQGVAVALRLLTHRTDDGRPLRNFAFVVPLSPLAPASRYTARAAGTVDGEAFAVDWSFRTAPSRALTLTLSERALPAIQHATVDVQLSGGTGRYLSVRVSDYGWRSAADSPPGIDALFSIEAAGSQGALRLRRGVTPCSGTPLSDCRLRIEGRDSAGTVVSAVLPIE